MTLDLNRIDGFADFDEAIAALEDYVADLVEEFVKSPEGKSYLAAHPGEEEAVGGWIDQMIYFGYAYQSMTLPKMTKNDVEAIVTQLFPRKVTLLDPEQANSTIPELMAFWQFLQRVYKLRNASKIVSFLKKIAPKFKDLMNNSSNFGIAKSFFSSGISAGFDMTSQEGLQAFQAQYNQSLKSAENPLPELSALPNANDLPANLPPPPAQLSQLLNKIAAIIGVEKLDSDLENSPLPDRDTLDQEIRSTMWQNAAEELPPLSEEAIELLHQQTITETTPGTILQDFQMLLDFVGEAGIPASGTYYLIAQNLLSDLNQRLSNPIQIDLKRPAQKSYPPINGLYLLLRVTGLGKVFSKGKKNTLVLNSEILRSWQQLTPTERYFSLLEAYMIRASEQIVGERRSTLNEGTKCVQFWRSLPDQGKTFKQFSDQQTLNYWPEFHNLAMLNLFGFLKIESGKPEAGKGWRVKKIKRSPFGNAMMQILIHAFIEQGMEWESERNSLLPFGEFQPAFQPYFPEWKNVLAVPQSEFRSGVFAFKVSLGKAWRSIAISSDMTLYDLSRLILDSVDFDHDHLDLFEYRNQVGLLVRISHPLSEESPSTEEVKIGDLPFGEGTTFTYIFDFGDWWEFAVQLEKIQANDSRSNYAEILESYGDAPPQYPDWDEE
ncbi:MAG: plasmid pRiA4b ORF-3 family protein [Leptolyngbyaceae cyanobacterium SM1_3_5]|nr:plasmid pRiA4b ORF-3 family protein [Leptolyngbyaceae cyanobacterium SM1_3_5]